MPGRTERPESCLYESPGQDKGKDGEGEVREVTCAGLDCAPGTMSLCGWADGGEHRCQQVWREVLGLDVRGPDILEGMSLKPTCLFELEMQCPVVAASMSEGKRKKYGRGLA